MCGGTKEHLATCRSSIVAVSILDIVDVSGNGRWNVSLAHIITYDVFLSMHIKYHKYCPPTNWLTAPEMSRLAEE